MLGDEGDTFVRGGDGTFKLGVFRGGEHGFEVRAGTIPGGDEVAAGDEGCGAALDGLFLLVGGAGEVVQVELAVGAEAIGTMQGEVFFEVRQPEKAPEGGGLHLEHITEAHVVADEGEDLLAVFVGEAQAREKIFRDAGAGLGMAVEADAIAGPGGVRRLEGRGLADIVEQHAPGEGGGCAGGKVIEQHEGVDPDVALGVELRGLLDAVHAGDFGQDLLEQPGLVEELKGAAGMAFSEHARQLGLDALAGDLSDFSGVRADGGEGLGLECKLKPGGEADGTQHAQLVLSEAKVRRAGGADDAGVEVLAAVDEVEDGGGRRVDLAGGMVFQQPGVEEHAVDGEVAAKDVFARVSGEADGVGPAAIGVGAVVAEGGDFGGGGLTRGDVLYEDDTEVGANLETAGEERDDFSRGGAGGHVEVLRLDAEEQVTDAAACEEGLVAGGSEGCGDAARGGEGGTRADGGCHRS